MKQKANEVIIYNTPDGGVKLSVFVEDETVWLTQKQIAELFKTTKSNISEHVKTYTAKRN